MIWMDNARIGAIFAVIFLHMSAEVVVGNDIGTGYWWFGNLYDSLVRWCVPIFVMISGALLLDPNKKEDLAQFYKKRLSRILVPLLFWSAFYIMWAILKGQLKGDAPSGIELATRLLSGKPHAHLWFLYMILGLYVFTPFFRKVVAYSSDRELGLLVAFLFVISAANSVYDGVYPNSDPGLFINLFPRYIPYFIMGHIVRHTLIKPSNRLLFSIFVFSFLATMTGCYYISMQRGLNAGLYFYDYQSITVIPMSLSLIFLLKQWESPMLSEDITREISSLTLGAYLIHPTILPVLRYTGLMTTTFHPSVSVPVVSFFVFAVSLIAAWVIRQVPFIKRIV